MASDLLLKNHVSKGKPPLAKEFDFLRHLNKMNE